MVKQDLSPLHIGDRLAEQPASWGSARNAYQLKTKVQKKVVSHFRELRCDWCNKYHTIPTWKDTPTSEKMLSKWKEKFLSPAGTQKVLYECKTRACVRTRPEGWDDKWCYKCHRYDGSCTHDKM